jgi:uncharacterized hydrophobic protein (TIGR00271 family)
MKRFIAKLQDRIASLLGLEPARRTPLVRAMLHRPRGDAAGYWLQLVIAAALATLGLALDSAAVVIGAMLIAPLMRPIVELAMGLATGSTPLVFRTGLRAISSIVIVVAASAVFTWWLPFHEITPELLARTAPSILDLFVAAACAVAGAYAVVIASSDVATTAAGTSIGISLVPPLCTAGYGLSIGDWDLATGAALLFTANVTGIVIVASAVFVLVGFGQVNIREEEAALDNDAEVGAATRFGRVISRSGTRLGVVPRLLLPLVLLAAIAYPLLRAVDAMAHRSSIRQRIADLMKSSSAERIVQYSLDQSSRPITLRVVVVGDPASARSMEHRLHTELATLGEPSAAVAVWAVSDAKAVSALSARLDDVPSVLPEPAPEPPPPLSKRVRDAWPTQAGQLLDVWITDGSPPRARVAHLGAELGAAGREMLARATADGEPPVIEELALVTVEGDPKDVAKWLSGALALLSRAHDFPSVYFCVTTPAPTRRARPDLADELTRRVIADQSAANTNVLVRVAATWAVIPQLEPCAIEAAPGPT